MLSGSELAFYVKMLAAFRATAQTLKSSNMHFRHSVGIPKIERASKVICVVYFVKI